MCDWSLINLLMIDFRWKTQSKNLKRDSNIFSVIVCILCHVIITALNCKQCHRSKMQSNQNINFKFQKNYLCCKYKAFVWVYRAFHRFGWFGIRLKPIFTTYFPNCLKNDTQFKSGQIWLENNHHVLLI